MMALAAGHDRKRVKVYELKANDWFDRGTGFCTGETINVSTAVAHPTPSLRYPSWRTRAKRPLEDTMTASDNG
jgi:hypothetical protein